MKYIIDVPENYIENGKLRVRESSVDYDWYNTWIMATPYNETEGTAEEAWNLVRKIDNMPWQDVKRIFDIKNDEEPWFIMTYAKAREKYNAWENEQKNKIVVGDEIFFENGSHFVVFNVDERGCLSGMGYTNQGKCAACSNIDPIYVKKKKDARHFPEIVDIMKKLKYNK